MDPATNPSGQPPRASLRVKLVRTMIGTLSGVAAAVLVTVAALHIWTAQNTLALVEGKIQESIIRKGQGLVTNHSQALRGLVADNAFSDVRRLVEGAQREDLEVVYGLVIGADLQPWAYASPSTLAGAAAKDAWKELHIEPLAALRRARTQRPERRNMFGQEIFEFSAPIVGEEGASLGAIVYGISGAPLALALEKARADSRRSLLTAVVVLGGLAVATALFGLFLVRKAAARITQPLAELTQAASAIAAGKRSLRVAIKSGDELEDLGDAFNRMVADLNESYGRLEALNFTLEQRVAERTIELAERNRDLRLVLDTVNEGLVTLSREGTLAPERSAMVDRWFGPYTAPMRFIDYLAPIDRDFAEAFDLGNEALLEGILPAELCLAQLPRRLHADRREYAVTYLPITEGGEHRGLLVVINDVTEQLALAQQDAEQRELLALFQAFTRDRMGLLAFFEEASRLLEKVASGAQDLETQKRLVHTLKGNASLVGLNVVAQLCHRAEDEIDEHQRVQVTSTIVALRSRWLTLNQALKSFLGDRGDVVELPARELEHLREEVARGASAANILERLSAWRCEPVERPLERLAAHARALAQRLGKGDLIVDVEAHGLRLDPKRWAPLWSELVHVVRNAVDHGLESAEERRAAGKPPRPRLRLAAALREHNFSIEVEDDGRGIDWEGVRRSAARHGVAAHTEADLEAALLMSGISTRTEVTTTSGRGVGLAAVYARVQEFQGTATVSTRRGAGTTLRFSFPLSVLGPSEGAEAPAQERGPVGVGTAVS
jgi:two-component system chemotaxis sensor kinase CheA